MSDAASEAYWSAKPGARVVVRADSEAAAKARWLRRERARAAAAAAPPEAASITDAARACEDTYGSTKT